MLYALSLHEMFTIIFTKVLSNDKQNFSLLKSVLTTNDACGCLMKVMGIHRLELYSASPLEAHNPEARVSVEPDLEPEHPIQNEMQQWQYKFHLFHKIWSVLMIESIWLINNLCYPDFMPAACLVLFHIHILWDAFRCNKHCFLLQGKYDGLFVLHTWISKCAFFITCWCSSLTLSSLPSNLILLYYQLSFTLLIKYLLHCIFLGIIKHMPILGILLWALIRFSSVRQFSYIVGILQWLI